MLGKNALLTSTALVASLALAGCFGDSNTGGGAGTLEIDPAVMSATHGSVTVETGAASIVVNSLDLDTGEFNVTLTLADGVTEVTMTQDDIEEFNGLNDFNFGSSGEEGIRVKLDNEDDEVRLYIGLLPGADEDALITAEDGADIIDASLFVIAAIDPEGGGSDFNSYIVTGDQTQPGAMPGEGEATYNGVSRVSIYHNGVVTDNNPLEGDARVVAHFGAEATVDIDLWGDYSGDSWDLSGEGIVITDSLYEGIDQLTGDVNVSGIGKDADDMVGTVIGAFYGEEGEATAGVFGATGTDSLSHDIEIVGGFGAYVEGD